ncbi:NAD(P)H-hydrate dehydratase [Kaistella sp.]|uniref:NAD(P)H-hydrate dehydratase n=2 Tax=Kaistella sp. TaxID=2782235 RepID=UPI002F9470D6
MKIFTSPQIRKCDAFTIENEPVTSLALMERAATACAGWLSRKFSGETVYNIFCGHGNNGGDGFALARLLYHKGCDVNVFMDSAQNLSADAEINFKRTRDISGIEFSDFSKVNKFQFENESVIIDALFGTGLNKAIEGKSAELIKVLNELKFPKISIDIPSGLFADEVSDKNSVVFKADETLSFQFWKKAFLHSETGKFCGKINILDISLNSEFIENEISDSFVIDEGLVRGIYRPRQEFSHKGNFGKTVIAAGSSGKMGAAVLATQAALKTGSGLTFSLAPQCGYEILQTTCPEAMFLKSGQDFITSFDVDQDVILGIGPGLGTERETYDAFLAFLKTCDKSLVLDADALNMLAENTDHVNLIPKNSIITPHPKEFERLFGTTENSFERLNLAKDKAKELQIYIVLKDHHTQIVTPEGGVFYNLTGNSGMAKGGSGDVLLGILTSLLAQNYSVEEAALFGVWLHGKAGDFAAEKHSKEAMLPSDLIAELGNVFKYLNSSQ